MANVPSVCFCVRLACGRLFLILLLAHSTPSLGRRQPWNFQLVRLAFFLFWSSFTSFSADCLWLCCAPRTPCLSSCSWIYHTPSLVPCSSHGVLCSYHSYLLSSLRPRGLLSSQQPPSPLPASLLCVPFSLSPVWPPTAGPWNSFVVLLLCVPISIVLANSRSSFYLANTEMRG